MAISNYSELKTEIQATLKRSDLADKIDNWIDLFEKQLDQECYRDLNGWEGISGLSSTNTVNDILTAAPNLYLSGVLVEAYKFLRNSNEELKHQNALNVYKRTYKSYYSTKRAIDSGFKMPKRAVP